MFIKIEKNFESEKNLVIACMYRPPGTSLQMFVNEYSRILDKLQNENKVCYLMGDFNVNLLNSESHELTSTFVETLFSYSFVPLITKPTRVGVNCATLIDNIFTNSAVQNEIIPGILMTDISDHFPIFAKIPYRNNTENPQILTK